MKNLEIYEKARSIPDSAKKTINGGRLKGMTDINPIWRIKTLTEVFGPCGIGWYYTIDKREIVEGANGEKISCVDISLYIKIEEEWSKPIMGTGGSMFVAREKSGMYTSDEAFKMALTDAISVACKSLGIGADVYYEKDRTKYSENPQESQETKKEPIKPLLTPKHSNWKPVVEWLSKSGNTIAKVELKYHLPIDYREQLISEAMEFKNKQ